MFDRPCMLNTLLNVTTYYVSIICVIRIIRKTSIRKPFHFLFFLNSEISRNCIRIILDDLSMIPFPCYERDLMSIYLQLIRSLMFQLPYIFKVLTHPMFSERLKHLLLQCLLCHHSRSSSFPQNSPSLLNVMLHTINPHFIIYYTIRPKG